MPANALSLDDFLAPLNLTGVTADRFECAWFLRCTRAATHYEPHPALGWVPACDRCIAIGRTS